MAQEPIDRKLILVQVMHGIDITKWLQNQTAPSPVVCVCVFEWLLHVHCMLVLITRGHIKGMTEENTESKTFLASLIFAITQTIFKF